MTAITYRIEPDAENHKVDGFIDGLETGEYTTINPEGENTGFYVKPGFIGKISRIFDIVKSEIDKYI